MTFRTLGNPSCRHLHTRAGLDLDYFASSFLRTDRARGFYLNPTAVKSRFPRPIASRNQSASLAARRGNTSTNATARPANMAVTHPASSLFTSSIRHFMQRSHRSRNPPSRRRCDHELAALGGPKTAGTSTLLEDRADTAVPQDRGIRGRAPRFGNPQAQYAGRGVFPQQCARLIPRAGRPHTSGRWRKDAPGLEGIELSLRKSSPDSMGTNVVLRKARRRPCG